jgi:hypothetical protein
MKHLNFITEYVECLKSQIQKLSTPDIYTSVLHTPHAEKTELAAKCEHSQLVHLQLNAQKVLLGLRKL